MAKDNILLITTDQQRFDTLNAWGNQSIFTPHLNYMAAMGISYKNCYASCPICVPSRTTIMTGRTKAVLFPMKHMRPLCVPVPRNALPFPPF